MFIKVIKKTSLKELYVMDDFWIQLAEIDKGDIKYFKQWNHCWPVILLAMIYLRSVKFELFTNHKLIYEGCISLCSCTQGKYFKSEITMSYAATKLKNRTIILLITSGCIQQLISVLPGITFCAELRNSIWKCVSNYVYAYSSLPLLSACTGGSGMLPFS
jgi:hypothetical protein